MPLTPQTLKNWRRRVLGLTQVQFAKVIGANSDRNICRYETGEVPIPSYIDIIYDIFEFFPPAVRQDVIMSLLNRDIAR